MTIFTKYTEGTFNWTDIQTTDAKAACAFYTALFGWSYDAQPMGDDQYYYMATLEGKQGSIEPLLAPARYISSLV